MARATEKEKRSGGQCRGRKPVPRKLTLRVIEKPRIAPSGEAGLHPEIIRFLAECVYEMRTTGYDKRKD
jgi:hypothetical protein